MTIPKLFLVNDMASELAMALVRIEAQRKLLELHAKRIDALRKRVERSKAKAAKGLGP